MRRGSTLPLVMVLVLFLMVPLGFWFFYSRNSQDNVKGANVSGITNGMYVTVSSTGGTWDLVRYLCKGRSECVGSLSSGLQLETISGGNAQKYQVAFSYESGWDQYAFLKIYLKPGWGSHERTFDINNIGTIPGTTVEVLDKQQVVLIPLAPIKSGFFKSSDFSDQ